MAIVFSGPSARIRCHYALAATLGPWRIDGDTFTATIAQADGFRLTQTPLTLEIDNADGIPTRRHLVGIRVAGSTVSARVLLQRSER